MNGILNQVDKERIYKHIISMEGPRFPLDNFAKLEEAASYIKHEMESYKMRVEVQEFTLDQFEGTFKNIVGHLGNESEPAIIIGSHYDTVKNSPGANDNLTGVAVSLEIVRLISKIDNPPHVIMAAFTLEEGNPVINKKERELALKFGIQDDLGRYTSVRYLNLHSEMSHLKMKNLLVGNGFSSGIQQLIDQHKNELTSQEVRYFSELIDINKPYDGVEAQFTKIGTIGSNFWVENAISEGIKIAGMINLDTLGSVKKNRNSQELPPIPRFMLRVHKTKFRKMVGDFILIAADKNSSKLYNAFLAESRRYEVDVSYVGLKLPMTFPKIQKALPDILRADHAPFWKHNIPALFLTDTAEFRWDRYHTAADQSKYIDYEMLVKICKATIACLLKIK